MTDAQRIELAAIMNRLPFVRWDRFVEERTGVDGVGEAYGWIDRADRRADFVLIRWEYDLGGLGVGFTTSSAARTAEIRELLYAGEGALSHNECQRVDEHFGDLVANVAVTG